MNISEVDTKILFIIQIHFLNIWFGSAFSVTY